MRRAARIAIEHNPPSQWLERAAAETDATPSAEISLALARVGNVDAWRILEEKFADLCLEELRPEQQKAWIRALEILVLRRGTPLKEATVQKLEKFFPLNDSEPSRLLCELLVASGSPIAIERGLKFCTGKQPQEERMYYLFSLGMATQGWTVESRRAWLNAFTALRMEAVGGPAVPQQLDYLRSHFLSALSDDDRKTLASEIAAAERTSATVAVSAEPRPFVRAWTMDELQAELAKLTSAPDLANGQKLFTAATCIQCHRVGTEGGQIGPDLTAIGKRFDRRTMLESVIEPWKVVADPYRMASVTMKSGVIFNGRLMAEEPTALRIATNPIDPGSIALAPREQIASTLILSAMPPGLFNSLTATEVRDLLAWMETR